jgi:hypothetical protein
MSSLRKLTFVTIIVCNSDFKFFIGNEICHSDFKVLIDDNK